MMRWGKVYRISLKSDKYGPFTCRVVARNDDDATTLAIAAAAEEASAYGKNDGGLTVVESVLEHEMVVVHDSLNEERSTWQ